MMFNPMGSMIRSNGKSSVAQGRISTSKAKYSQIYERALQDKIQSKLYEQQQQGLSEKNQHTPSSASYQMTLSTLELIEFVLREYEQTNSVMMQPVATKKQSYTIYEDLKIVYQLGKEGSSINSASYKRLADEGYVRRSLESIKSRYVDYLKNLTKEDYQDILSFVEINGLKGFLIFEKNNSGVRLLQRIQKNDPRTESGSGGFNSGHHTPVRSPMRSFAGANEKQSSPNLFRRSPQQPVSQQGYMPYMYPPFPMYPPPQQYQNHQSISPYKQFFDPYAMQMMMMNQFMAAQSYPQMMTQQQRRFQMQSFGEDDQDVEFEVRKSSKQSVSKAATSDVDEEKLSAGPRKKVKANSEENARKNQKESQKDQGNNFLRPPQMHYSNEQNRTSTVPKVQSTLMFQKPFQSTLKPTSIQSNSHSNDAELRLSTTAPRALTKEVYDLISDEDRIATEDFESVLDYVSQELKMPKEKLVDTLDSLSGSFKDFAVYFETKQENMLWNAEEDKILESINSQDSSEFKLLIKLKGLPSIKKRILYSKIEVPFPIQ